MSDSTLDSDIRDEPASSSVPTSATAVLRNRIKWLRWKVRQQAVQIENLSKWRLIETAPKDGRAILLLSTAYDTDSGEANGGIVHFPPKVAIGHWWAEGTSWVCEGAHPEKSIYTLAKTGIWLSGGGWFQPDEVTHWREVPSPQEVL